MRDVENDNNATALSKLTVKIGHSINWGTTIYWILKSTIINANLLNRFKQTLSNVLNDKEVRLFFIFIPNFHFVILALQFSRPSTKRKFVCSAIVAILTVFILLIVSRDLVRLRYFIFSFFKSFPAECS